MPNGQMNSKNVCSCKHHKVSPIALIVIGLVIVAQSFGILVGGPLAMLIIGAMIILIGVMKMMGSKCKCC